MSIYSNDPPPPDRLGSGRIVKTIQLEPSQVLSLLKNTHFVDVIPNQPHNPLPQKVSSDGTMLISTTSKSFLRESRKQGTILITTNSVFGTTILLVKEVHRSVRPANDLMPIHYFLDNWPGCTKDEFLSRNYVKAGKQTLLQRFRYVVPKSLPWHWIVPKQTVDKLFVCDVSFVSEIINARKASSLYTTGKSPHFLCYYPVVDSENNLSNILIEQCDMCMSNYFRIFERSEKTLQSYLVQSLLALAVMQSEFKMIHNDMFVYNLSVKKVRDHTLWNSKKMLDYDWLEYDVSGQKIWMKSPEYIVKVTGFGFSASFETPGGAVRNDMYSGELEEVGMWSSYTEKSDIMTLLLDFMINYECVAAERCIRKISDHYGFSSIDYMLEQILVRGANYRIDTNYLDGLEMGWVLGLLMEECDSEIVRLDKPVCDTIMSIKIIET